MNLVIAPRSGGARLTRVVLAARLREILLSGQLAARDPLPSTRVLARAVGVSRTTVVAAYEELAGEGYVDMVPGSGTYVAEELSETALPRFERAADSLNPQHPAAAQASPVPSGINMMPGSPAAQFGRNPEWARAWKSATAGELPAVPPPAAGTPELREEIAQHLRATRGVHCTAENIVVTSGTNDGIALLVHALRPRSGKYSIATEDPGYPSARSVISMLGADPMPIPVSNGGIDVAHLRASDDPIAAALVTPSHQYPLGGRLPVAARLELLAWARERQAFILEDDYDSEFRYGASPLPSIASLDEHHRVALLGSYSKTLTPWLRCGYLFVNNAALLERIIAVRAALGPSVSGAMQTALAHFHASGGLRRHLMRVGRVYAHRRALVLNAAHQFHAKYRLSALEGGLHATITWRSEPRAETIVAELAHRAIRVAPLHRYFHHSDAHEQEGIVFGYGAPSDTQLQRGVDAIAEVLRAH